MIPMEIKTGKEYIYHHAQASLYSLLFKDRYDKNIDSYLLIQRKRLRKSAHQNFRVAFIGEFENRVSNYIKTI